VKFRKIEILLEDVLSGFTGVELTVGVLLVVDEGIPVEVIELVFR